MKRSETSIKTERLWLRQIDETDSESIVVLRSDEDVYKYFLNPKRLSVAEHRVWYNTDYIKSDDRIDWIAVDDETGEFIGVYGAKKMDDATVEVSYLTAERKKHQGYAAEAIKAIMDWCQSEKKEAIFVVNIHEENIPSIKFAEYMGFHTVKKKGLFLEMRMGE